MPITGTHERQVLIYSASPKRVNTISMKQTKIYRQNVRDSFQSRSSHLAIGTCRVEAWGAIDPGASRGQMAPGARSKFRAPMFEPEVFRKQMYSIEVLLTLLGLFCALPIHPASGELCPPRYATGRRRNGCKVWICFGCEQGSKPNRQRGISQRHRV